MRWGPQEKGMREEPREEGEEGHGREDEMTDGRMAVREGGRQHPVDGPLDAGRGWVEGETVSRGRARPEERSPNTVSSISQPCYSPLTQPAHNEHPVYAGHAAGHWGEKAS